MLQNAYFLAKIGADTAENEQHFAEILPKTDHDQPDLLLVGGRLEARAELRRHVVAAEAPRRPGRQPPVGAPGAPRLSKWSRFSFFFRSPFFNKQTLKNHEFDKFDCQNYHSFANLK